MTPVASSLPAIGWRVDSMPRGSTWDSGIGAELYGGRWNSAGTKVVYASLDPSTAILEVAVHKGFRALDTVAHVMSSFRILDRSAIAVIEPKDVPDPAWLLPGTPGAGQQAFGDDLVKKHKFVAIPSAVSTFAWNLIFSPVTAAGSYRLEHQTRLVLDTRLNPPPGKP